MTLVVVDDPNGSHDLISNLDINSEERQRFIGAVISSIRRFWKITNRYLLYHVPLFVQKGEFQVTPGHSSPRIRPPYRT